jgi:hypothetical protein
MNYLALLKGFWKEAFDLKQYKHLGPVFGALAFVAVLPFVISAFSIILSFVILGFVYNALESSVKFLEAWIEEQKKGIRHATEAVLYVVAMPWVFLCMALLSSFAMIFYFLWFSLQVSAYIATLGGIKWQPFITYTSYDENKRWLVTTNSVASIIITISLLVFFLSSIIFFVVAIAVDSEECLVFFGIFEFVYLLSSYIAVPIVFRKKNVEDASETISASSQNEGDDNADGLGDCIPEI